MKWLSFLLLGLACVCCRSGAFGRETETAEQKKYNAELKQFPDIAYREKAFQLFLFMADDLRDEKNLNSFSVVYHRMKKTVVEIWMELGEVNVFGELDKPVPEARLARLSPAARIFYAYYRQALLHNPVFRDLYKRTKDSDLYLPYRNYHLRGRPESERLAYEAAARVLDGERKPTASFLETLHNMPPFRPAAQVADAQDHSTRSRFSFRIAGGVLLAAVVLALVATVLYRRRKNKNAQELRS